MRHRLLIPDRYEAAIRLERIRQLMREYARYGYPLTVQHMAECRAAEAEYDAATEPL